MIETLMKRTQAMSLEVLTLSAFASSNRKVGFMQTGKILKKFFEGDKYIGKIITTKME